MKHDDLFLHSAAAQPSELREGLEPLLTKQERESYALKAVFGSVNKEEFQSKLGDLVYSSSVYRKVKRIDIPLRHDDLALLIVAFDTTSDHESIIFKKILPLVEKLLTHFKAK